ncbi:tetratricopeptide repeat protein 6 isoform X1 [Anolis carolinensis]|uniref:tetratricopeptide repeat protein 6 isoform X1 n=1 Tax=Anolis carolinensis TaxID=28377 RepID=UPI002F2B3314
MARKREHLGLSYLEELSLFKERENICKESRREFLKFKQEAAIVHSAQNKPILEVTPAEESSDIQLYSCLTSKSPFLLPESLFEEDDSKFPPKVRIFPEVPKEEKQAEDAATHQKKSEKEVRPGSGKAVLECKSDSKKYKRKKMSVAIASLAGTSKQLSLLKKPEPTPKPKYSKVVSPKLLFPSPSLLPKDSTYTEQLEQKHDAERAVARPIKSFPQGSPLSKKSPKTGKEMSKPSVLSSVLDLDKSHRRKSTIPPGMKSAPDSGEDTRADRTKSHMRQSIQSKSQIRISVQNVSSNSGIVRRSIDEIIASLKSTALTESDIRIKELLESILGHDYNIKIDLPAVQKDIEPAEMESSGAEVLPGEAELIELPSPATKEFLPAEFESPIETLTEQVTSADAEQIKEISAEPEEENISHRLQQEDAIEEEGAIEEIPGSAPKESIFYQEQQEASIVEEDTVKIEDIPEILRRGSILSKAQQEIEDTVKVKALEQITEVLEGKIIHVSRTPSQEGPKVQESEEFSFSEAEELESTSSISETLKITEEESEEFLPPYMGLSIKGKAFTKLKPAEIQKGLEELSEPQSVSVLSTWTTTIRDVDYPLIHLLCTACPECVLPVDLQFVSRVHHTLDKRGHNILLPPFNLVNYKSEELFPAAAALEDEMERERICNEGLPVSEVYQDSQEDGINVFPALKTMSEWQRAAELYVEKPQLELLGKKVKLQPGSLKMFWTPAPQKFSAPLSLMKKTLFPKYESNVINGVICEDFSCDLRDIDELESDEDFDSLFESLTQDVRSNSCPQLSSSPKDIEIEPFTRSNSAPELSLYRGTTGLKISADFKTTMEQISVMKKHMSSKDIRVLIPEVKVSPAKPQHSPPPPPIDEDLRSLTNLFPITNQGSDSASGKLKKKSRKNLFPSTPEPEEPSQPSVSLDDSSLAEASRKAGLTYIIFPKKGQGRRKSGKSVSPRVLENIREKLNEFPRTLKRSASLGKLHAHSKCSIKVSRVVRLYRSPSLPCYLDFEKFAKEKGRPPEDDEFDWCRVIWNKWFDEVYPFSSLAIEDGESSSKKEEETKGKELADTVNPLLLRGKTDENDRCQSEIDRLTLQINEGSSSAFNYCRRGAIYRKLGKMQAAMDDLEKAINLEPALIDAYWHRHLIFLYQNKTLPALEDLNFIIKYNKTHADAYLSRADIYKKQGDNSLAIINYTLAAKSRPTDDEIYYKRGEAHEDEGDLQLAIDDYTKCLYYNPKRTDALMKHGIYYFNKSAWNAAVNDFTTVIEEDPNHAEARTYRGRAYLKLEKYEKAAEDLCAAIHLNPCNWIAYYYRGCILRKLHPKQALQDFSVSVLLNYSYDNLGALLHRGILYAELKEWALAICDFESALELDRTLTAAYINIGVIMMLHLDHFFESIRQFTHAIKLDPLDIRPYLCRAQAYQKIHDLKYAVRDINRAIHLYPNSAHLCLIRGQYLLEMKKFELASFCIHQVAEMDKGFFECSLVQEALVQSFCQNHNKAIECAQAAAKKQPEPPMFVLLGKIQMKAKKHKDAVVSFKQALKLLTGSAKSPPNTFEAAEMFFLIGECYMEQVCLIEACEAFTSAVKLYPRYADAYYQRGLCRMYLQRAKSILDFNKTLAVAPNHFQAYLSRAAYYGSKGRFSKAIANCTEAIKIQPKSVRAYLYRGTLKCYNKTYKQAVQDLTTSIDLDNTCMLAYYNRAISYHLLKDYKNALKDYGIVLLLEANKDIVLKVVINRGLLYTELDQYMAALEDFTEAMLSKPRDSQLFKVIGQCYHRLQKYEEAVQSFSEVLKIDPFSVDGYIGRGNAYMEYGHIEGTQQAQKDFLKAIHMYPISVKARLCLGYNLQALGKFQKAWAQFTAAILIDPKCHIAYDGRAIVCLQMSDTFAAFQDTNAALKIITSAELLTNRGVINQFMGYLNCAMNDYQQAITVDPNYALAYFNAANIYFLNRQFVQANNYYSKALTLDPKNESAFLNRAITNTLLKKFEEAKADFENAICLSPFSAAIYFNKANLHKTLQQYEQAEEDISKALSIQPYDSLMYKLRADIRGKMGLIKEAIADYRKAISIQELISTG